MFVACAVCAQAQTLSDTILTSYSHVMDSAALAPVKVNGYRIQVYSGGNSREAKREASNIGYRVQFLYPELSVYTRFVSPRWICRVGDFRTHEEAAEQLEEMRKVMGAQLKEATVVRCKVSIPAYMLKEETDSLKF